MRFAVADPFVDQLRGVDHHEQRIAIALGLGPLMRLERILDRQVMQAELFLKFAQHRFLRLVQTNPDEAVRAL